MQETEGPEPNQGRGIKRNKVAAKDYISLLGLPYEILQIGCHKQQEFIFSQFWKLEVQD